MAIDPATMIRSQVVLDEHDHSPDGRFAIVTKRTVVRDRYRVHLWLIPLGDRGAPTRLTSGNVRDTSPRIAPDGSAVALRRSHGTPGGGKPALCSVSGARQCGQPPPIARGAASMADQAAGAAKAAARAKQRMSEVMLD